MIMKQIENLDNEIVLQLENNGLKKGDREQRIKLLLTHAYMAVKMYWAMSPEDRYLATEWNRKFRRSFSFRNFLKARKTNSRKNYLPPAPPMQKKEYKEKTEKNPPTVMRVKRTLKVRKMEFWNELLTYEEKYDRQTLLKFYYYWSEQVTGRRKMRLELERSWETEYRLAGWVKRSYQANDEAAALRLERAKGKKSAPQAVNTQELQALAAKRAEDNDRLEREIAERKQGAVSYEEYLKMKSKNEQL
jgi:hypothetical protein